MGNQQGQTNSGFYTNASQKIDNNITYDPNSTYFNNEMDKMLSEIASEIDNQYQHGANEPNKSNKSILNTHNKSGSTDNSDSNDDINDNVSLSFVPQENIIHKISDIFTYRKQLGTGASSRVLLVYDPKTDTEYALKELQKHDKRNKLLFFTEYQILKKLNGHSYILSYYSSYIDNNCYYLAFEYHSGGTMLDRILENGSFCEAECAEFIKNVLNGLKYMHNNNIVHRDLKCENLIFDKKGKGGMVKIIDFGNSELITNPLIFDNKIVGSLHYLPPELLHSKKRAKKTLYKGDMWAIGVVCFILVTGKVPFYGSNQQETLNAIRKGVFEWPKKKNINLSESCKDFISRLLCININNRMDCNDALSQEWISKKGKALNTIFGNEYLDAIEIFSKTNKLQKILISCVLNEMEEKEKKILLKALRDLNMNGNNNEINQNHIINYVLMYEQLFSNNKNENEMKTNIINNKNYSVSIENMDIEGILEEIDEIDAMDEAIQTIPTHIYDKSNTNENENENEKKYKFAMLEEDSEDEQLLIEDDDDNDNENDHLNAEIERHKLNFYDFSSAQSFDSDAENNKYFSNKSTSYSSPNQKTKISVERFSQLLRKAEKEYDVKSLVSSLSPTNSGNIPLKNINGFKGALHSKESNQKIKYELMKLQLTTIDSVTENDTQNISFVDSE